MQGLDSHGEEFVKSRKEAWSDVGFDKTPL